MRVAGGEQAGVAGLGGLGERSSARRTGRHGQGTRSATDAGLAGGGGLSCPPAPMGFWTSKPFANTAGSAAEAPRIPRQLQLMPCANE